MNEERRRLLIDALETALAGQGVNLYDGAQRLLRFMDANRHLVEASGSRETLDAYFMDISEDEAVELSMYIALASALPGLLEQFVTDCVVKTSATIPAPVGPPRKLTPEIEREIVKRLTQLYTRDGVRIGTAQGRVAQQLGLGKRSVQSVWQKRQQVAAEPFQSMRDVWEFFERATPTHE